MLDKQMSYKEVKISENYNIYDVENVIYSDLSDETNREELYVILYDRYQRYLKAISYKNSSTEKSGFVMVAVSCLIIESLYSFINGIDNTVNRSKKAFNSFFEHFEEIFPEFKNGGDGFYTHIRCGIFHQAEPTGGWRIRRDKQADGNCKDVKAIDVKNKIVEANILVCKVEMALNAVGEKLKEDEDLARRVARKFSFIIEKHK